MTPRALAMAVTALAAALSCQAPPAPACAPGRSIACACPGSTVHGTQVCLADGSGFDVCDGCGPTSAGFSDATHAAGLLYHQSAPLQGFDDCVALEACQLNIITGGAAVGDYDADGWPDLFVTTLKATPILFRNQGNGTFADVTKAAGLAQAGSTNGAAWVDIDNDGDLDLYVLSIGHDRHHLYVSDGKGHFSEDAKARGLALDDGRIKAGMSVAVGDYDRDGWLDLQLAEWGPKGSGDNGFLDPALPDHNRLLHNLGKKAPGHFEDVTVAAYAELDEPGIDGKRPNTFGYSNAFADFDGDDWPDFALAADFRSSHFRWNEKGKFSEATTVAGTGKETFGMGAAIGDLDGDGRLDWFVTSISDAPSCVLNLCNSGETGNHLYLYQGNRHFEDAALKLGLAKGYWGWGAEMLDFDNDGDLDLVQTNGTSFPFVPQDDFFTRDPMRFWRHDGDKFVEASAALGLTDTRQGKAVVTFDYDHDGDLDVFIVNNASTPVLYRNETRGGDWLRVRVLTESGRDAIGAKLRLTVREGARPQVTHVGLGSRFLSQSEAVAHFGLGSGSLPVAELVVHWSDTGKEKTLTNLARNTVVVVKP